MARPRAIEVYVTFPSVLDAARTVTTVIRERLAACGNVWGIRSTYRWRGVMKTRNEVAALIKTTATRYPALERRLKALHRDNVPCIIAWPITKGYAPYLRWIKDSTNA